MDEPPFSRHGRRPRIGLRGWGLDRGDTRWLTALQCVTMVDMTTQFYNMAATAASAIWANPLILAGLIAVVLTISTGVAGRVAIVLEDLRYTHFGLRSN